jgi:hypothetical protein
MKQNAKERLKQKSFPVRFTERLFQPSFRIGTFSGRTKLKMRRRSNYEK